MKIGILGLGKMGEALVQYLGGIREKRAALEKNRKALWDILNDGAAKARKTAAETMDITRSQTGLKYGQ